MSVVVVTNTAEPTHSNRQGQLTCTLATSPWCILLQHHHDDHQKKIFLSINFSRIHNRNLIYMWQDMTKGTILRIFWIFVLTCNAYNLESIATTDFKFGVMILISSCYTCKHKMWWSSNMIDLCTLPDQTGSGCGPDFPQFGSSPFGTGGLLQLLTLDLWSRSPKLSKYQVGGLGLLWPWNGDSLKTAIWSLFSYPTTYIYKFNTEVIR